MVFGGFQKLTLLDFPGKVACILFTKGCNFRCPFCHNAALVEVDGKEQNIEEEEVLAFLKKRQGILEGVCITGGEPLLQVGLEDFLKKVKDLGYAIKLDTNGSFPQKLKDLAKKGLVDYVAMDIKNTKEKYAQTAGCDCDVEAVEESIDFLLHNHIDYEFRTTVVAEFHTPQDIGGIAKRIEGAPQYFLQNFVDSGHILEENLHPVEENDLVLMEIAAQKFVKTAKIRGKE